ARERVYGGGLVLAGKLGMDITRIARKEPKPDKNRHENEKNTLEPGIYHQKSAKSTLVNSWEARRISSTCLSFGLGTCSKVLSMQDDEAEPAELKEVIEVVTTAKLITEVVTAATTTTITAAPMPKASAARRRKGVVIRDPKETATPSVIVHSEPKSKDKGKRILVEEPKPLKRQAQIEQDEAYARELEAELNANINWNEVIELKDM
nr:hypothetical protein [Tanacetum cinerariifolium]